MVGEELMNLASCVFGDYITPMDACNSKLESEEVIACRATVLLHYIHHVLLIACTDRCGQLLTSSLWGRTSVYSHHVPFPSG